MKIIGRFAIGFTLLLLLAWPNWKALLAKPQTATTHSVTLTWTPSTSTGVTSQIVYRATSASGPWTVLTTIPNNTTATYTDTTAVPGTQYFYELDSEIGTTLSGPSNVVSATEPSNPNPPLGLQAVAN